MLAALLTWAVAGCGKMHISINQPTGSILELVMKREKLQIPGVHPIPMGKHPCELTITDEHAKKLGFAGSFKLYGWLTVGLPTETSKLTNVTLDVPDDLILAAKTEGRVLEVYAYDDSSGTILVSLKLGEIDPRVRR